MPNPFLVSDIESRSTGELVEKASEYRLVIENLSRLRSSTALRLAQQVELARDVILGELERRKGKPGR